MEEVLKHAENIQNIGQMLSRIGEENEDKEKFNINGEPLQPSCPRDSPIG